MCPRGWCTKPVTCLPPGNQRTKSLDISPMSKEWPQWRCLFLVLANQEAETGRSLNSG